MLGLELISTTLPAGKKLTMDLANQDALKNLALFTIKEGIPYKYDCILIVGMSLSHSLSVQRSHEVQSKSRYHICE